MSSLKFTVKEDGNLFPLCHMSTHECYAIEECIQRLLPAPSSDLYWFTIHTSVDDPEDDDAPYGLVKCITFNREDPVGGVLSGANEPHPLPEELINAIGGKTFVIHPRKYGVNAWGKKVEVLFESCRPAKPTGIKASTLIALKA